MTTQRMSRKGSDNVYLHKDFHGALSAGIEYLDRNFGEEAVREYLRRFVVSFYAPLIREIKARGLIALKEHFERVYAVEGGTIHIDLADDEMILKVDDCPAVMYMREHGYAVARLFSETTKTLDEALCEGTPFAAELVEYDDGTGHSVQRFTRRAE